MVQKINEMKTKITILGCVLILISFCIYYRYNLVEDKGTWIRLQEDCPQDGYILHKGQIYGCYLDDLKDISRVSPMEDVDIATFEVCKGTGYARDKRKVYYPLWVICADGADFGYSYFNEYVVKKKLFGLITLDVNPHHFKYIANGYAVDGHTMFYRGEEIKWDDNIISKAEGADNSVIKGKSSDTLSIKDMGKWEYLSDGESYGLYNRIGNHIYGGYTVSNSDIINHTPLSGVDIKTFQVCKGGDYAKDVNHLYFPIELIYNEGEDECWFGDKYIVNGVNPEKFKFLGMYSGENYGICGLKMYIDDHEADWNEKIIEHFQKHNDNVPSCKYCKNKK